uniref:Uncharacterized protein n=1 Tax=Laticauda laticaudata TaxID=8630 RepID=A0A8C5SC61_LATLA
MISRKLCSGSEFRNPIKYLCDYSEPFCQASCQPTCQASCQPFCQPTCQASCQPTCQASCQPWCLPASLRAWLPAKPWCQPSCQPSCQPWCLPAPHASQVRSATEEHQQPSHYPLSPAAC